MQPQDKKKRKQKFLIVLPLFIIGLTGLLIAGINIMKKRTPDADGKPKMTKSAFNTVLPAPNLPTKEKNKLELYMQADKDSATRESAWENDPNKKRLYDPGPDTSYKTSNHTPIIKSGKSHPPVSTAIMDPNEKKVNDRLQKLYAALNQSDNLEKQQKTPGFIGMTEPAQMGKSSPETERLEKLLQASRTPDTTVDPNLQRVERVLDKVLDIQHPERKGTQTQIGASEKKPSIYEVSTTPAALPDAAPPYPDISLSAANGFYELQQDPSEDTVNNGSTIQAVVHETQTLQNGSTIKLRLLQDIFVGGHRIPANNFIYGDCSVNNERLNIRLTSAVSNNQIYPIALKVYDMDGLEGIAVPGAITRDVTKEGVSQGISGMGITSLDPSLGAQAAAAGIETAKTLISKKVKAVIVTVKADHRVLLENPRTAH